MMIEYAINIATTGDAIDFGDLTQKSEMLHAVISNGHGGL